jgi:hypothetical protein
MNGIPYEAVGIIDSRLETVGVWQKGGESHKRVYIRILFSFSLSFSLDFESVICCFLNGSLIL